MKLEAAVSLQPRLHLRMLVRAVVIHDEMQRHIPGKFGVEPTQELQEFLVTMTAVALTDDFALQKLERSE